MKERSKVLVVGAGSIGERHIRCFLATERAEVEFVEPNDSLREAIICKHPRTKSHCSLDSGLSQTTFDMAVIATPALFHVAQAIELARRKVHVLIEKPLSVTMAGISDLRQIAQSNSVVIAIAYVQRCNPVLSEMRAAVNSGEFGRPVELVAVCGQNFPFYRPAYRETYYVRHETGGGAVQDALTHIINTCQWIVGDIDRVVADVDHKVLGGVEVEDTAHALARHGEVLASYSLNQHQAPNETTITVICENGTVRFEGHHHRWLSMKSPGDPWSEHASRPLERDELFVRQANAFLDCIERGATPVCSLDEGVATLRANLAILQSAQSGGWINLRDM